MRHILIAAALGTLMLPAVPAPAEAGPIQTACQRSDRAGATRPLCACIQQVADRHLNRRDQRQAARFFRDPDRAQQVRMSRTDRDRAFWQRYRAFTDSAQTLCR